METDLLDLSPMDPAYFSLEAHRARVQHLLDYARKHAPDPDVEAFLLARLAALGAQDANTKGST